MAANPKQIESLKSYAASLPASPGVYIMKDARQVIIYVGKAKNLRARVKSYFTGMKNLSLKTKVLVDNIYSIEVISLSSESEALITERTLIKHHAPKFNIMLRDDKQYPYMKINVNDKWPRFKKVRVKEQDGCKYIGPFVSGSNLSVALHHMLDIFPIIRCSEYEFKKAKRPCNYYHLKKCLGPCVYDVSSEHYREIVNNAISFLEGDNENLRKKLKQHMETASERLEFESAAQLRDQLSALENLSLADNSEWGDIEEADAIGFFRFGDTVSCEVIEIRKYRISSAHNFKLRLPLDEFSEVSDFVIPFYENRYVPMEILFADSHEEIDDLAAILRSIGSAGDGRLQIKHPSRGQRGKILRYAERNAQIALELEHGKVNIDPRQGLSELQSLLKLRKFPEVIECFDISNFSGKEIVASKVSFKNGKPDKNKYRKYAVKEVVDNPDDYKSMREVISRRIVRGMQEEDLPDLIIVDGGKGQLNVALEAYKESGCSQEIEFASLAKKKNENEKILSSVAGGETLQLPSERIFLPGRKDPIRLKEGSSAYRLAVQLRDEAHRFAITYLRQKRMASQISSELENVPGCGKILAKRLLTELGSLEKIKQADRERLQLVKGVTRSLADAIVEYFKKTPTI